MKMNGHQAVYLNTKSQWHSYGSEITSPVLNELWEGLLAREGKCRARVTSDSMRPFIMTNERVLVEKANADDIRFGDVVVFKKDGNHFSHRIIGKKRQNKIYYFLEKGDAMLVGSFISGEDIIGRIISIERDEKAIRLDSLRGNISRRLLAWLSLIAIKGWAVLSYFLYPARNTKPFRTVQSLYSKVFTALRWTVIAVLGCR